MNEEKDYKNKTLSQYEMLESVYYRLTKLLLEYFFSSLSTKYFSKLTPKLKGHMAEIG